MKNEAEELDAAIETLYAVFARYPLSERVSGCAHCVEESDVDRLQAKPLRELSAEDLRKYARKAMTTWGTLEDFKHFLPRLFESVTDSSHSITEEVDAEVLFGKLGYAQWRTWPEDEQEAIEHYLLALWRYLLTGTLKTVHISEFVCAVGHAVDDLTPFLRTWRQTPTPAALNLLREFMDDNQGTLSKRRHLCNAFWSGRRAQMAQVVDWLLDPRTTALVATEDARWGLDRSELS